MFSFIKCELKDYKKYILTYFERKEQFTKN
jgi:hypothetical protein